jgi:hypothetical protein
MVVLRILAAEGLRRLGVPLLPLAAHTSSSLRFPCLAVRPFLDTPIKEELDLFVQRSMLPFSELGQFCFELGWNAQKDADF